MRGSLFPARLLTAALVALAVAAATVSAALATSSTVSANGLAVTASLSPDTVSKGQTVTQAFSVKNVTAANENVSIRIIGVEPTTAPTTISTTLTPSGTLSRSMTFPAALLKPGSHTLTVIAVNRATGAATQASASIAVN